MFYLSVLIPSVTLLHVRNGVLPYLKCFLHIILAFSVPFDCSLERKSLENRIAFFVDSDESEGVNDGGVRMTSLWRAQ
jgi:hypothetical protein